MNPTRPLSPDALFFFEHAGFSYDPISQTRNEGRTLTAEKLAEAETLFLRAVQLVPDVSCVWEYDSDAAHDARRSGYSEGNSVEFCVLQCELGVLASLSGIWDADDTYRRVVRAELAYEAREVLAELIAAAE